jgi:hypothetical protein
MMCKFLMVELLKTADNADGVVLLLKVRIKVSSDATVLRLLPSSTESSSNVEVQVLNGRAAKNG